MRIERDIAYLEYGLVTAVSGQVQSVFRYHDIKRTPGHLVAPTHNVRGGPIAILNESYIRLLV